MTTSTRQTKYDDLFNQKIKEKQVLIAAHRGIGGGNIIANTIPGFIAALKAGADILELDVVKSTDGEYFVFHDGTEPYNFKIKQNIKTMSSKKIRSLRFYNAANYLSEFSVNTLKEVLETFKGKTLLNIDRAWDIFPGLFNYLVQFDMAEQILVKSPVSKNVLKFIDQSDQKFMYMPIIRDVSEVDVVLQYQDINMVGMELVTDNAKSGLLDDGLIERIKDLGLFAWVNAVTFNETNVLYAGMDDNTSIINNPDDGWGKLIDKGFQVILTDWPGLLYKYRLERIGV